MTRTNRARIAYARCAQKAERAETRARAARTTHGYQEWMELAATYQRSADEWAATLEQMDESTEGCPDCGSALDAPCADGCDCHRCDADRAADAFADAHEDYLV